MTGSIQYQMHSCSNDCGALLSALRAGHQAGAGHDPVVYRVAQSSKLQTCAARRNGMQKTLLQPVAATLYVHGQLAQHIRACMHARICVHGHASA